MSGPGPSQASGVGPAGNEPPASADGDPAPPVSEGLYGTLAAAAAAPAPAPAPGPGEIEPPPAAQPPPQEPSTQRESRATQARLWPPPPDRRPPRLERDWDSSESEQELEPAARPDPPRESRWRRTLRALRLTRSLMCRCRSGRGPPVSAPAPPPAPDAPAAESRLLVSHFTELSRDGSLVQRTVHTTVDFVHRLVPDLLGIVNSPFYWGEMDRFEAERLLENKPEGTFLLRDSAQEEYLFSVSFRRYGRSLHARVEQLGRFFSFDAHDHAVFAAETVTALIEHYKDASRCMFFEPLLTRPLPRTFAFPLSHLCRAAIVDRVGYDDITRLRLPRVVRRFLMEYHYKQPVRVRRFELPEDGGEPVERTRRVGSARWTRPARRGTPAGTE